MLGLPRLAQVRILLIEDFPALRSSLSDGLRGEGYAVDAAATGDEGWWLAAHEAFDLILLDLMLPGLDGFEILRRLRASGRQVPVLLLTARDEVDDRVRGLDLGADDYLTKPFAVEELLARIRALIRRGHGRHEALIRVGDLEIDPATRLARRGATPLDLAPREYALLERLARGAGTVVTRDELCASIYEFSEDLSSNVIEATVARLRRRLGEPPLLHTRRGFGYLLAERDA